MIICIGKLTVVRIKAELTHADPLLRPVPEAPLSKSQVKTTCICSSKSNLHYWTPRF
jgi:hypothetical protein